MTDVDALHAAIQAKEAIQSLDMGRDQFLTLVQQESNGPLAAPLFRWICSQGADSLAGDSAVALVSATRDPAALAEIVDLLPGQKLDDALLRRLWNAFLSRVDDKESVYGVRTQALHGALLLAQHQKGLLYQLKGFLTDLDLDDDPHFLRHAARILGVVLAHSPEDEFREKLMALLAIPEARDEAAMELGLDALRNGLDAKEHEPAAKAFEAALHWFNSALDASEDRVDADLYARCLNILVRVQRDGFSFQPARSIAGLAEAVWKYSAYLGSDDSEHPSWLGARSSERLHWTLLASKLGILGNQLSKKVWMNATRAIEEELLAVYRASRSILCWNEDTGLDLVIRPQLTASLLVFRRHLDELDQWIEDNEGSTLLQDAVAMRNAVEQAREANMLRRPFMDGSEGRALQSIADAGRVSEEGMNSLAAMLHSAFNDLLLNENPIANELAIDILNQMARNEDFSKISQARSLFKAVLILSANFLGYRHETGTASDPDGAYLFIRSPSRLPRENVLQRDYFRFLRASGIPARMEVGDQGGGRVDVHFSALGISTVTEVKRTKKNQDHVTLLQSYGLQTAAYQTTNVTFGFLLVLDLWDRGGGQPHLREQMSLQRRTPPGQETAYDIVVMRVQGQRKPPSDLH